MGADNAEEHADARTLSDAAQTNVQRCGLTLEERKNHGRAAKDLLNYGRVLFLQQRGFSVTYTVNQCDFVVYYDFIISFFYGGAAGALGARIKVKAFFIISLAVINGVE